MYKLGTVTKYYPGNGYGFIESEPGKGDFFHVRGETVVKRGQFEPDFDEGTVRIHSKNLCEGQQLVYEPVWDKYHGRYNAIRWAHVAEWRRVQLEIDSRRYVCWRSKTQGSLPLPPQEEWSGTLEEALALSLEMLPAEEMGKRNWQITRKWYTRDIGAYKDFEVCQDPRIAYLSFVPKAPVLPPLPEPQVKENTGPCNSFASCVAAEECLRDPECPFEATSREQELYEQVVPAKEALTAF